MCVCVWERKREREHLHAWFQSNAHDIHIVTGVRNVSRETWPVHDFIWWRDTGLQEITRKYAQPLLSTGTKQEIFFSRFHLEWRRFHWWIAIRDSPPWFLIRFARRNRWLFDVRFFDFSSFIRYSSLDRIELLIFFFFVETNVSPRYVSRLLISFKGNEWIRENIWIVRRGIKNNNRRKNGW